MDVTELQKSLQDLMDRQKDKPATVPDPEPDPVEVKADPYEHLYAPAAAGTSTFDDHLLDDNEPAGDVASTSAATAAYRAKRTGFQGLLASVLIAVGGVLAAVQLDAEVNWSLLGLLVGQAALTAIISFLHNDKSADGR